MISAIENSLMLIWCQQITTMYDLKVVTIKTNHFYEFTMIVVSALNP